MSMLDYGVITEHDATGNRQKWFGEFRKYCKEIGKTPSNITEKELDVFSEIMEKNDLGLTQE